MEIGKRVNVAEQIKVEKVGNLVDLFIAKNQRITLSREEAEYLLSELEHIMALKSWNETWQEFHNKQNRMEG